MINFINCCNFKKGAVVSGRTLLAILIIKYDQSDTQAMHIGWSAMKFYTIWDSLIIFNKCRNFKKGAVISGNARFRNFCTTLRYTGIIHIWWSAIKF